MAVAAVSNQSVPSPVDTSHTLWDLRQNVNQVEEMPKIARECGLGFGYVSQLQS